MDKMFMSQITAWIKIDLVLITTERAHIWAF